MKYLTAIFAVSVLAVATATATADSTSTSNETYQGKAITWWAKHAVQARKDANARASTIHRLKRTLAHNTTIEECVKLATITYPALSEGRAWRIIYRESWTSGKQFAKNRYSTASGLYQFLTSTWGSTPYRHMSIWSPCASSLAAGWMHQNGRGGEWNYG